MSTTLYKIEEKLSYARKKCASCDQLLEFGMGSKMENYDHDGGIWLENYEKKQWVTVKCPCGYNSALWKLLKQL